MLLEFEVGNFRSFKSPVRFSLVAANPIKEYLDDNTFQVSRYRLLRSAAIYGANASGKSNLLIAMNFMREFVLGSPKGMPTDEIPVKPFKLDAETENAPSHFEVCFLLNGKRFRYGFQADRKAVRKEWLFFTEGTKEAALFLREGDGIDVTSQFGEGKGLERNTRDNALFLSVVAQLNGKVAGSILQWFNGFRVLRAHRDQDYEGYTARQLMQNTVMRPLLVKLIQCADVGIEDLVVKEEALVREFPGFQHKSTRFKLSTVHRKFRGDTETGIAHLSFATEESEGTKKFFRIAGPVLDCLANGYVVCIDEMDAKLHPLLTKAVVQLFNSVASNPRNAQLVFTTHDTNLLYYGKLRRDQIWFTEKNKQAATDLYSLAEFKLSDGVKVRNDANFEKNYIQGRYGAIPFLGNMEELLKEAGNGPLRKTD